MSGYMVNVGEATVTWDSGQQNNQQHSLLSTCEAEHCAMTMSFQEMLSISRVMKATGGEHRHIAVPMTSDNRVAVRWAVY